MNGAGLGGVTKPLSGQHWIDHLVLAAPSLHVGIAEVRRLTGVAPEFGGSHPGFGTCNALLSLGAATYLEVIAPDPEQAAPPRPRVGLADAPPVPRLVALAVGCADIEWTVAMLAAAESHGEPFVVTAPSVMTRRRPDGREVTWRVATIDGRVGGAHPFLISWDGGPSPAVDSPHGGRLVAMRAGAREPAPTTALLAALGLDVPVEPAGADWLTATIETASRRVTLR